MKIVSKTATTVRHSDPGVGLPLRRPLPLHRVVPDLANALERPLLMTVRLNGNAPRHKDNLAHFQFRRRMFLFNTKPER